MTNLEASKILKLSSRKSDDEPTTTTPAPEPYPDPHDNSDGYPTGLMPAMMGLLQ